MRRIHRTTLLLPLFTALLWLGVSRPLAAEEPKKLTHAQAMTQAVAKPAPAYPATAKQLKLEGSVELNAFIGEDGAVTKVEGVSGNPVLVRAAEDALKRWKFTPVKEDGKAVKAVAAVHFSFKL